MIYIIVYIKELGFSYVLSSSKVSDVNTAIRILEKQLSSMNNFYGFELYTIGQLDVFLEYSPFIEIDSFESLIEEVNKLK